MNTNPPTHTLFQNTPCSSAKCTKKTQRLKCTKTPPEMYQKTPAGVFFFGFGYILGVVQGVFGIWQGIFWYILGDLLVHFGGVFWYILGGGGLWYILDILGDLWYNQGGGVAGL